ncbi:Ethylene-responsive transcription factor ERF020 [Linum grandiflorum]
MSNPADDGGDKKYKGVRRRKWGKWVSEIRVPGTQERLWLGSYSSPEAAAFAHDVASYCLKGNSSSPSNFPTTALPAALRQDMSPKSVQRAASDAGMAVDAQMILMNSQDGAGSGSSGKEGEELNVSVEDYL